MRALVLACLAAPAAACPGAEDLAGGVAFLLESGQIERHVAEGDMIDARLLTTLGAETGEGRRALHGVYPLVSELGHTRLTHDWPAGLAALPYPRLGLAEDIALVTTQSRFAFPGIFSISVGDTPTRVRLGACELEVWGVATSVTLGEDRGYSTFYHWYPALGTGVRVRWGENGVLSGKATVVGVEW
ncbi:MAG: hypothetical protein AAFP13_16085 [Pseudomonadota bacterium]